MFFVHYRADPWEERAIDNDVRDTQNEDDCKRLVGEG